MAFDLNKSGDEKKKFDLSKSGNTQNPPISSGIKNSNEVKRNSNNWIWAILGLAIIGAGIWYFTSRSNKPNDQSFATSSGDSIQTSQATLKSDSVPSTASDVNKQNPENQSAPAISNSEKVSADSINRIDSKDSLNATINDKNKTSATPGIKTDAKKISKNEQPSNVKSESSNSSNSKISNSPASGNSKSSNNPSQVVSISNQMPATFNTGSAILISINKTVVNDIIKQLKANPSAVLTVNGYASSEGDKAINESLSQKRAEAFRNYLNSKGISKERINAIGKGIENPIASNETENGRRKNRRVETQLQ